MTAPNLSAAPLKIVVAGHVDHGKSTMIGRLLYETGALTPKQLAALKESSVRRGMPTEWSFALDALQIERDQAVTIDTTQIRLSTATRQLIIIDAPGHREFLRNMVSGAAAADAALLVVDAIEGVAEQTRRHGYLLHLLGIDQVAAVVNKIDMVGFAEPRFREISAQVTAYLGELGIAPRAIVPISARHGDNVASRSARMPWYAGPSVLETLDRFNGDAPPVNRPLRLPVQDIYKFDERRIVAGRVEAGILRVGDTLLFSPSDKRARVRSIETWHGETWHGPPQIEAHAGQSVGITLDEPIFVERGNIASGEATAPALTNVFGATLFWLGERPLGVGRVYRMKLATREAGVTIQKINRIIDSATLNNAPGPLLERDNVADVVLRSAELIALDDARFGGPTSRFVLVEDFNVVGGGLISMEGYPDERRALTARASNVTLTAHEVASDERAVRNRHRGGVLWLTGLSGAGKSTLAIAVERELFHRGYAVYALDGDNVRLGLNANLGFSPEDRTENIRRVGEVAALFADAGLVCITSFISPYQTDRDRARAAARQQFHEIYVKADLEVCERRDPKGLYKRARAGEIANFTGISSPYEPPSAPDLIIETDKMGIDECVSTIVDYVEHHFRLAGPATNR
jgi:bifunctional enzyme CysN/CysC